MKIANQIKQHIFEAAGAAGFDLKREDVELEHPVLEEHGDYSSNVALKIKQGNPQEIAEKILAKLPKNELWQKVQIDGPGFVNFWIAQEVLVKEVTEIGDKGEKYGRGEVLAGEKIMVEYAHPNTHKEMHIGHMRTLITGEALARIIDFSGATVFRANYQGDIGPHVAKAIWGTGKILKDKGQVWDQAEKLSLMERAHLLGQGYVRGNQDYGENKVEIDQINKQLYEKDPNIWPIYQQTRKWSLDYYDEFYKRFYTQFDRLYFESEVAENGKKIVLENVQGLPAGRQVFEKSDGAIIFDGERLGLHKRVFVTSDGNPTYEGKEMALGPLEYADFPFDLCIHVVASEQMGYFEVVFAALAQLDPKFKNKEFHLSMGMVQLVGKKMSSRTGVLVTVDGLVDDVKELLKPKLHSENLTKVEKEEILETATIAAVKYSVLKTSPLLNATFDLEKSVSLEGDSGPYLQYTFARAQSVLRKANFQFPISNTQSIFNDKNFQFKNEELSILRYLYRFPEVVEAAAKQYAPNLIATYLFELAKRFNNMYNNCPILGNPLRESLTAAMTQILKNGLNLLGIEALERM